MVFKVMRYYLLPVVSLLLLSCSQKPRFELLDAERTGIYFNNRVEQSDSLNVLSFEYIYNGAGVGVADLNNDGMQDLFFTGNQVSPQVYLNQGNFRFSNISSAFEGIDNGQWYSGIAIADINGDGWNDVYLTCTAYDDSTVRRNRLFINQGPGPDGKLSFIDLAEEYGLADDSYTVHASFFDYDLDGDLDLYLMNNFVNDRLSASYRPKILDGTAASNDDLYRNNGDGTFSNVTIEAGIVYEGFGLGLAMGDVNKDGYPDIYVSNDYVSNDLLYINQGDGTFSNEIDTYLSYQTKSSMGNDMADVNNDGYPDMFTLDMFPEYYHKKKQTINGFGYIYYINDEKYGYEHQYLRNMLHLHGGFTGGEMNPFSEVGQMMGVYSSEWSWSPLFADFDNDGDKDLLIANGYPVDMTDKDWTMYKVELYGSVASDRHVISRLPVLKIPNFAFENKNGVEFGKVSDDWFEQVSSFSYGAAYVDLDKDGDLDYVTNNLNDEAFIYRNRTIERSGKTSKYIRIKLNGPKNNRCAYGAKIEIWSPDGYQFQENFLSRGYISSMEPVVHFGLKEQELVDSIRITWPGDQNFSVLYNIPVNQVIEVSAEEAKPFTAKEAAPADEEYLFMQVRDMVNYKHQEQDYIDFFYSQVTLPHKFSQIGPRMQKGDINGDGREDIIVGATSLLPTSVFLNKGNRFIQEEISGLTGLKEYSEGDISIFDVDLDGDNDVLVVAGWYDKYQGEHIHYLYLNEEGAFQRIPLPVGIFMSSVIRPKDFDHDGDMDLFIGSRVKKDMFPFADDSWILINEGGTYTTEHVLNFNLGMVTDAVWADYDGDGWEDLVVAREWNSLTILKNLEGSRLVSQEIPVIDDLHGIWYSIAPGDFDQDGDTDFIVGNLGDNHRFTISREYPMRIYAFDLDLNGTVDPISTAYWKDRNDVMREFPINYMDELIGQSQFFMEKYKTYTSFSYATMDDLFDSEIRDRIDYTCYTHTGSSQILWNGEKGFHWQKLPAAAQVSPITKIIVKDLNGDELPDAILAGNDHTYDVGTGYYDANKGLVLLSRDGDPLADLKAPEQTGLLLNGMVESLFLLEGDTSLLIAGTNRDSVIVHRVIR
ncbi:MAG: VCBS repeat-containing protein [Bacteroidota bacterium]